ncbi:MAG: cation:proton antiporter [Solirubrobacteraceae bacterium]|nr:cation:proton antiporter [Solirubrobacteraceae bacterium]
MADGTLASLLLTAAVMIGAARGVGWLFERIGQPAVIGEIVGGLILGPTVLGAVAPDLQRLLVPSIAGGHGDGIELLAELGLLVLMFSAGSRAVAKVPRADARTILSVAALGMALPFGLGLFAVQFLDLQPILGPADSTLALEIVLATVLAITSVPVIARILADLGLGDSRFARLVLVVGVLEDLTLYAVLGVAVGLVATPGAFGLAADLGIAAGSAPGVTIYAVVTAGLLGAAYAAARANVWQRVAERLSPHDELSLLLGGAGLAIAGASYLGVSSAFAALMFGVATTTDGSHARRASIERVEAIGLSALVPLYFASVGARLDLASDLHLGFTLQLLVLGCALKAASVYAGARIAREPSTVALPLAVALNARGGQGIIAATLALGAGILNDAGFASIVVLALVTSAFAGWWLRRNRAALLEPASPPEPPGPAPSLPGAARGMG